MTHTDRLRAEAQQWRLEADRAWGRARGHFNRGADMAAQHHRTRASVLEACALSIETLAETFDREQES